MLKKIEAIRNLITIILLVVLTNFCYAQKIELESLNIMNSDLRVEGGNLIIKENATVLLNSKINIKGGDKDEYKVRIVFSGVDANMKDVRATAEYTYSKKSNTNGNNLSLKLPPHTQLRISSVTHFVDDWQGETAYFSINKPTPKTNFALLLNGSPKPINKGVCQYGRCYCIEGSGGSDCGSEKKIEFNSMLISQTIEKNKENDYTWSMTTGFNQNANNNNIPSIDQLIVWGELEAFITAELVDAKGNKETYKIPCDLNTDKGICLFNGKKNMQSPLGVTLTATICHFRTAPGAVLGISSTSIYLRNNTSYQKPSSDSFTWTETWVADHKTDICKAPELENIFLNEVITADNFAVVLGLNNTKKKPSDLELAMSNGTMKVTARYIWTEGNDKRTTIEVQPSADSNGNWTFKGFKPKEFNIKTTSFNGFEISAYSKCNTSFKFESIYKRKLSDKKDWEYNVTMKNTVAYDNPVYQPANDIQTNVLALTAPSSAIQISGGNLVIRDNAKFTIGLSNLHFGKNIGKHRIGRVHSSWNKVNEVLKSGDVLKTGNKIYTFTHEWNEKTMQYEALVSFEGTEKAPAEISEILVTIVTESKDTFIYEYEGKYGTSLDNKTLYLELKKKEKNKYDDPCNTNYRLKTVSYDEVTVSGIYALKFSFSMENNSDKPHSTAMIVEIKDCNGKSQFIGITLNYNATTGMYTGGVNLSVMDKCNYTFHYGEIGAYNECKDKTVWSITAADSKSNGKGTRAVATTNNGKPNLL